VLAPGNVGFGLIGQGVVEAGELSTLIGLLEADVLGVGRDALPDYLREGLVGVGGGGQLGADPILRDSGVVLGLLVDVPSAVCQFVVGCLDGESPLVVLVESATASFVEL
jgi:hypothetical protein